MTKKTAMIPGLSKTAGAWYRRCTVEFRLKTSGELGTLLEAARSLSRIEECQKAIKRDGLFVAGDRGIVAHPAAREERQHRALFLQAVRQLGISSPIHDPEGGHGEPEA
jgi:hypothetical protein